MDTSRWGLPVRRVERNPHATPLPPDQWPMAVPAVAQLTDPAATGTAQVLVATRSPLMAALPGARELLLDDDGLADVPRDALPLVAHWRAVTDDPAAD